MVLHDRHILKLLLLKGALEHVIQPVIKGVSYSTWMSLNLVCLEMARFHSTDKAFKLGRI